MASGRDHRVEAREVPVYGCGRNVLARSDRSPVGFGDPLLRRNGDGSADYLVAGLIDPCRALHHPVAARRPSPPSLLNHSARMIAASNLNARRVDTYRTSGTEPDLPRTQLVQV